MTDFIRKNAVVCDTTLGAEDHGIFTFGLDLHYGGGVHQGAGYVSLSGGDPAKYMARGLEMLADVIRVAGVDSWEKIKGRNVVALFDTDRWNAPVRGLEHILGERRVVWADYYGGQQEGGSE